MASTIYPEMMDEHLRDLWKIKPGQSTGVKARFPNVNTPQDVINLVNSLKQQYDVPVGIKIAGTHFIERELEVIAQTQADFSLSMVKKVEHQPQHLRQKMIWDYQRCSHWPVQVIGLKSKENGSNLQFL